MKEKKKIVRKACLIFFNVILDILLIFVFIGICIGVFYSYQIKVRNEKYANIFGYSFFEVATGNIYRNRAIGCWLEDNQIEVIPNVRFGDERTFPYCVLGIRKNSIISIGTHGLIKVNEDRKYLKQGLEYVIKHIKPPIIVVYGKAPDDVFLKYKEQGIKILQFESEFSLTHKKVVI